MEIGNQSACFLDLRISIVGNKLTTTVYSKSADSHLYLHADSFHKKSSVKGIQQGVVLRLGRIVVVIMSVQLSPKNMLSIW